MLSILKLDTGSIADDQSTLQTSALSDDFLLELKGAPERVTLMAAWSAIILLEVAVHWIDQQTDIATNEIIDTLFKVFGKPSNDDPLT